MDYLLRPLCKGGRGGSYGRGGVGNGGLWWPEMAGKVAGLCAVAAVALVFFAGDQGWYAGNEKWLLVVTK